MTSSTSKKATPVEEITLDAILDILAERIADRLSGRAEATGAEPEPDEPEPDKDETEEQEAEEQEAEEQDAEEQDAEEEEVDEEEVDEEEVDDEYDDWSDDDLREEAIKRGFSEDEVGVAERDGVIDVLRADDRGEAETDGEEEEEEEPDEDEETDPREQLEHLSVRQLRKRARLDYGLTDDDIRGLDRDALIDLMLGETEEDEQAEEEEQEGEEPEEEEEDVEEYTIDDLTALPRKELLAQAKAYGVSVRPRAKAEDIAEAIMEAANTA